ncbi:MAG: Glyoxalase/bleomycin resistance protein/dioxygenase [Hyphomicrobiales bacterium]|jgi:catechol 2,3-dioxygenase-like lactoylglutathione lyase family enzyme|nr:Glyoxalase/bleomycin resistance protein/dioxygenase [Hyphomicrobiales bacterium]
MSANSPTKSPIKGLFHYAYPCRDAEETRAFYEDILGLPLVSCMLVDSVPSTGEPGPYAHLFFEMGDGSYIAFFDLGNNAMPLPSPNVPKWVQHFAVEVPSVADVEAMKQRLDAAGVEVLGVVDHEFIKSIYFFDPNGLRLEITTRTEPPGYQEKEKSEAHEGLANWLKIKREKLLQAAHA